MLQILNIFVVTDLMIFLLHVTGSVVAKKKSIEVQFIEEEFGTVTAHTCTNTICFPSNLSGDSEPSFDDFSSLMKTVIDGVGLDYNTV